MNLNNKIKSGTISIIIFITAVTVQAQTPNVTENLKEGFGAQLKKATVPGLRFATQTTMLQPKKEDNHTEPQNSIRKVKNGTAVGVNYATPQPTQIRANENKKQVKLASDSLSAPAKKPVIIQAPPVQQ